MEMHPECRFIEPADTCELFRHVESKDNRAVAMGPWPCALHKGSILEWAMAPVEYPAFGLQHYIIISIFKMICQSSKDCSC